MKTIKFRAWDKERNEWVEGLITGPATKGNITEITVARRSFALMQFTGLLDKNGTEIYEGDITEILAEDGKKNRFVVRWGIARRVMDTGWQVDIPGFYFDLIGGQFQAFPIVKNYKGVHDLTMMEIVGNVYLNPDLLNILSLSKGKKGSP